MYISSDKHTELSQGLFDKTIELRKEGANSIKQYEIAYQDVIENVFPSMCWYDVTSCQIFDHLMLYKDPVATVIAILKGLKEDE